MGSSRIESLFFLLSLMSVASHLRFYVESYCLRIRVSEIWLNWFLAFEMGLKKSNAKSTSLKAGYQMTTVVLR